jgi:hypothetical protein
MNALGGVDGVFYVLRAVWKIDGVYSNLDFIIIIILVIVIIIIIESYYGHPGHSCLHKVEVRTITLKVAESRSSIVILLMRNNNH